MLVQAPALTVKGNPTNAPGNEQDIGGGTAFQTLQVNSTATALQWATPQNAGTQVRGATFSGGNSAVVAANMTDVSIIIPQDSIITRCTVLTKGGTGSCELDIWTSPVASYPPTVANSICPSNHPKIIGGIDRDDSTLTGFNTSLPAGNVVTFHLVSTSVFTEITIMISVTPTATNSPTGYTDAQAVAAVKAAMTNAGNVLASGAVGAITLNTGTGSTWGANSVAQNGYTTLPNGLVIQWGKFTTTGAGPTSDFAVSFPLTFPNNCWNVQVTGSRSVASDGQAANGSNFVTNLTTTGCTITIDSHGGTLYTGYWFAIGN